MDINHDIGQRGFDMTLHGNRTEVYRVVSSRSYHHTTAHAQLEVKLTAVKINDRLEVKLTAVKMNGRRFLIEDLQLCF